MTPGMVDALSGLLIIFAIGAVLWGIAEIVDRIEKRFRK